MQIAIFSKRAQTLDGKTFYKYLSTLHRKDGTEQPIAVSFRTDSCAQPDPAKCPMNIVVARENANLAARHYTNADGEDRIGYTLWVTQWAPGEPYVDDSLDDFID